MSRGRWRPPAPNQADLFTAPAPAWVAAHWPDYVLSSITSERPTRSPHEQWAEAVEHLAPAARRVLVMLARDHASAAPCVAIPTIASRLGMARNTCRRHLDKLMEAGVVMVRPRRLGEACRGYDVRLIVDDGDRFAAIADGFTSTRIVLRQPVGRTLLDG